MGIRRTAVDAIPRTHEGGFSVADTNGVCACSTPYAEGDLIKRDWQLGLVWAQDCCGDSVSVAKLMNVESEGYTPLEADHPVMPHGKSKADMCGLCFLIHSTMQAECE